MVEEILEILKRSPDDPDLILVDIRQPEEYEGGWIADTRNINVSDPSFEERISALDRDKRYILYCRRGVRASKALEIMRNCGFWEVYSIQGGIENWRSHGLPVQRRHS